MNKNNLLIRGRIYTTLIGVIQSFIVFVPITMLVPQIEGAVQYFRGAFDVILPVSIILYLYASRKIEPLIKHQDGGHMDDHHEIVWYPASFACFISIIIYYWGSLSIIWMTGNTLSGILSIFFTLLLTAMGIHLLNGILMVVGSSILGNMLKRFSEKY